MQAVNSNSSKKMMDAMSKAYINAKRSSHELEGITRGLIRGGTSVPLRGTPQEVQQVRTCACSTSGAHMCMLSQVRTCAC